MMPQGRPTVEAVALVEKIRQIGLGLVAGLVIAAAMFGGAAFAASGGETPEYAGALQKIFASLDAEGANIPFGGPIAPPLGLTRPLVTVHELPPVRTRSMDVVHVFTRIEDGSGYIVIRFTASGYVALRLDRDFNFVAAAAQRYGQPAVALTGAAAEDLLSQESQEWQTIAARLGPHR